MRNVGYFSLICFSLGRSDLHFLLNHIKNIDNELEGIYFRVVLDDEFSFIVTWDLWCILELEGVIVCVVNDEGFFINSVFQSELGNNEFGGSFDW
jgi:hypothetical protein